MTPSRAALGRAVVTEVPEARQALMKPSWRDRCERGVHMAETLTGYGLPWRRPRSRASGGGTAASWTTIGERVPAVPARRRRRLRADACARRRTLLTQAAPAIAARLDARCASFAAAAATAYQLALALLKIVVAASTADSPLDRRSISCELRLPLRHQPAPQRASATLDPTSSMPSASTAMAWSDSRRSADVLAQPSATAPPHESLWCSPRRLRSRSARSTAATTLGGDRSATASCCRAARSTPPTRADDGRDVSDRRDARPQPSPREPLVERVLLVEPDRAR